MKLVIGADHRGFSHKEFIKTGMKYITWHDIGTDDEQRTDYPIFAHAVSLYIKKGKADRGVLLCGSGVGMAIVANRYPSIYAAVVWNETVARQCKLHDNANVLVIPTDYVTPSQAVAMIKVWLDTEFLSGRYAKRIDMINNT